MPEPGLDDARLKAVVFDLDGTLYRQDTLRRAMLVRLLHAHVLHPITALRTARVLAAYRQAQELLRETPDLAQAHVDLAEAQLELAGKRTHAKRDFVAECVARWMDDEPLRLMARCRQPDLIEFLDLCRQRGLRLGVLSDYPAEAKITALGLGGVFDVILSAQSSEVGVFKPHPRGLLRIADLLGASPGECVYIGDRAEVDGPAAASAGMACFIVTRKVSTQSPGPWRSVGGFRQLTEWLNRPSTAPEQPVLPAVVKI